MNTVQYLSMAESISKKNSSVESGHEHNEAVGERIESPTVEHSSVTNNHILIDNINNQESCTTSKKQNEMESDVATFKTDGKLNGNENSLKIKISNTSGKFRVNKVYCANEDEITILNEDSNRYSSDLPAETNCKESTEAANEIFYVNGHLDESVAVNKSEEEASSDSLSLEKSVSAMKDMKLNLNCTIRGGKILSHWEIMNKCLNKKILFEALRIPSTFPKVYKCTVCSFSRSFPQHVLLHMRSHKDLTSVFELYQNIEHLPIPFVDKKDTKEEPNQVTTSRRRGRKSSLANQAQEIPQLSSLVIQSEYSNISSDSDDKSTKLEQVVQRLKRRKRRKRRKNELTNWAHAALTSGGSDSEETNTDTIKHKSVTDVEVSDSDDNIASRLRKRKPSRFDSYGDDFISDLYDSTQDCDLFEGMHYEDFSEAVTPDNPHYCQHCGMKFIRSGGIDRHYEKHAHEMSSPTQKKKSKKKTKEFVKNGTVSTTCQTNLSYKIGLLPSEQERELQTIRELERLVNKVLEYFVRDVDVLMKLGWPERNVSELLVDILERCNIIPIYQSSSEFSKLQTIRQNVSELLTFCIKDEVMDNYGWGDQLVDDVIQDIIAKIEYNYSDDDL